MEYCVAKGVKISALSLGTVQLGVNYGISNTSGKPDRTEAFAILDTAAKNGINTLDTAGVYGDSEVVIGEWLKTVVPENRPFIVTKGKNLDHSSLSALRRSAKEQVESSKKRLGLDILPCFMLHSCDENLEDEKNVKTVFNELKESGDIKFSGISAYAHHDYGEIAASGFDAVQIPLNLFDWRQIDSGGVKALEESGMMVFVRSVYLQGLVFRDPDALDPRMEFCRDALTKFRSLCAKYGLSPAELAISFAISLKGITSLVLGSEKAEQVEQNVSLFSRAVTLSEKQMEEIREAFSGIDTRVVTPTEWFNA